MDKLLILADDFTGALDTGVQFTKKGIKARIVTDSQYDFELLKPNDVLLSINTNTRPCTGDDAYACVFSLAKKAKNTGFTHLYKKTDSGLRGNIGAELTAAMEAWGENVIVFVPALPKLNRITKDGIQYIDGIPVAESVFGQDPFEPVKFSDVAQIIQTQAEVDVVKVKNEDYDTVSLDYDRPTVVLFDAQTDEDLRKIAVRLKKDGHTGLCAGCAGFAEIYDIMIKLEEAPAEYWQKSEGLMALCGSVNRITTEQLEYAEQQGFERMHLTNEQKMNLLYENEDIRKSFCDELYKRLLNTDKFLLDTLDEAGKECILEYAERQGLTMLDIRNRIAGTLGMIAMELVNRGLDFTFSMTGGDTLMGFMECLGMKELTPICEIGKGAVLSELVWNQKRIQVISKSGGFGEKDIFLSMYDMVCQK